MEPVQPANQLSNTTRLDSSQSAITEESRFNDAMAAATSSVERSPDRWELGGNALDQYRRGLQKLLDDALVDQAFANARIAVLLSAIAVERMQNDPEFEGRVLHSLYNGMLTATHFAIPAYLLLRVRADGALETSPGGEETASEYEEEAIKAFWTRHPVSAGLNSTDSWPLSYEQKPKARRKLDRRRIRVWLERRRRQFLAKQKALYGVLAGLGRQPRFEPEARENNGHIRFSA